MRFFVPRAKGSRFGARETQIELNGRFCGLRTAFPQVVNGGGKGSRRLEENGGNQGTACVVVRVVLEKTSQA